MSDPTPARGGSSQLPGVIDTLSAGYGVINRRPWIILIPILLDLFFWFGPRVSVAPIVGQIMTLPGVERGIGPDGAEAMSSMREALVEAAEELNLLSLLSPGWIAVPTVMPILGGARGPFTMLDSFLDAFVIAVATLLGGALLGCLYRTIIAQQVRDQAIALSAIPREAILSWTRLLGLAVLLVAIGLLIAVPLAVLVAGATLVSRELGSFGIAMIMTAVLWIQLYLFFAPDAIFVSRVGPRAAIRRSVAVVRSNFWAAIRIIGLTTIILLGMGQVWIGLANQVPWGKALGILGNAYIASGLVAASMLFYRERAAALSIRRVPAVWEV